MFCETSSKFEIRTVRKKKLNSKKPDFFISVLEQYVRNFDLTFKP